MGSVNKAILVGNLGRDAEMRFTAGGTPVDLLQGTGDRIAVAADGRTPMLSRLLLERSHPFAVLGEPLAEGRVEVRLRTTSELEGPATASEAPR